MKSILAKILSAAGATQQVSFSSMHVKPVRKTPKVNPPGTKMKRLASKGRLDGTSNTTSVSLAFKQIMIDRNKSRMKHGLSPRQMKKYCL